MPATEITTKIIGQIIGKDIHQSTGHKGNTYNTVGDWVAQKRQVNISVKDVTSSVLVCSNDGAGWAAFEEHVSGNTLVTVLEIT